MSHQPGITLTQGIDEYFVENRTRLLEIAAFLDRLDRLNGAASDAAAAPDFRMTAFDAALDILADGGPDRLARIQMLLSDPTAAPLTALDRKSAIGAWDHWREEGQR